MIKVGMAAGLCCALWGGFAAQTAQAAAFAPTAHLDFTVDQDSGPGQFSQWRATDISGLNALRATLAVRRLGKDGKWSPSFNIALANSRETVRLRIVGTPGKPLLLMFVEKWVGENKASEEMVMLPPNLDEEFGVDMDWSLTGKVTVLIHDKANAKLSGFERHEAQMDGAPTQLTLVGSTGEIEYKHLQLGTAAP